MYIVLHVLQNLSGCNSSASLMRRKFDFSLCRASWSNLVSSSTPMRSARTVSISSSCLTANDQIRGSHPSPLRHSPEGLLQRFQALNVILILILILRMNMSVFFCGLRKYCPRQEYKFFGLIRAGLSCLLSFFHLSAAISSLGFESRF